MSKKIQEIMDIMQEECGEIVQMVSKIRRFGIDETHLKEGKSNRVLLTEELGDILTMINLLVLHGVVTDDGLAAAQAAKVEKLKIWSTIYDKDAI